MKEWIDAIEVNNLVHLLEAAALSALFRTESRGVHYRDDHPHTNNDRWLVETIIPGGRFVVSKRPASVSTLSPPKGIWPYLDMLKMMMEAHSDVGGHH